jgi:hypothetical protein
VEAAVSESSGKRLETAETNQGGPGASSSASGKRQQISVGAPFSGGRFTSSRFRLNVGFLATSLTDTEGLPQEELDLSALEVRTAPGGTLIPPETWQRDADPYVEWDPPASGVEVAGYSYAVDADPDDTIDTQGTSWDIALDPFHHLADGQHTLAVKALGTSGLSGTPSQAAIWVDTTKPAMAAHGPTGDAWVKTLSPTLTVTLTDAASGIDAHTLRVSVNGHLLPASAITFVMSTGVLTTIPSTESREGENTIQVEANDLAGNSATPLIWSVKIDTVPPTAGLVINADAHGLGADMTTSAYVTLTLAATDALSGVASMWLSNDGVNYAREPFVPMKTLWRLLPVSGARSVWVKMEDGAGNLSEPATADEIQLVLLAPETLILGGPAGVTQDVSGEFTFGCSATECVYAYQYDNQDWSDWSETSTAAPATPLALGNHYFRVKAAKDTNGDEGIQLEEEDPTPAERAWIIGVEMPPQIGPGGPPVKLWRIE